MSCLSLEALRRGCDKCREEGVLSPICTAVCLNVVFTLMGEGELAATREWAKAVLGFEPVGIEEVLGDMLGRATNTVKLLAKTAAYICSKMAE